MQPQEAFQMNSLAHMVPSLVLMTGFSSSNTLLILAVDRGNLLYSLLVIHQHIIIIMRSSSTSRLMHLQLGHGLAGAIQDVLEHLGDKLRALVGLQHREHDCSQLCHQRLPPGDLLHRRPVIRS